MASGRALLAHQRPDEIERIIALGLPKYGPATITDPEALRRELAEIRERGWSRDDGDFFSGVRAAASTIFDQQNRPVAAISVLGLESNVSLEQLDRIGARVHQVCAEISSLLGREVAESDSPPAERPTNDPAESPRMRTRRRADTAARHKQAS